MPVVSWQELDLGSGAADTLRAARVSPNAAAVLTSVLGFTVPEDLKGYTEAQILGIGLDDVDARRVLGLRAAIRQDAATLKAELSRLLGKEKSGALPRSNSKDLGARSRPAFASSNSSVWDVFSVPRAQSLNGGTASSSLSSLRRAKSLQPQPSSKSLGGGSSSSSRSNSIKSVRPEAGEALPGRQVALVRLSATTLSGLVAEVNKMQGGSAECPVVIDLGGAVISEPLPVAPSPGAAAPPPPTFTIRTSHVVLVDGSLRLQCDKSGAAQQLRLEGCEGMLMRKMRLVLVGPPATRQGTTDLQQAPPTMLEVAAGSSLSMQSCKMESINAAGRGTVIAVCGRDSRLSLKDTTISAGGKHTAIAVVSGGKLLAAGCTIQGGTHCLHVHKEAGQPASRAELDDSKLFGTTALDGIVVSGADCIVKARGCSINQNKGGYGVRVECAARCELTACTLAGNGSGSALAELHGALAISSNTKVDKAVKVTSGGTHTVLA